MLAGLVNLARSKLIREHDVDNSYIANLSSAARLAVVDVRLMLDYEPRREAFAREAELVESHMRIAYSVPKNQAYLRSGYPSEPIVAEAAAQQLHTFRKRASYALINILKENIQNGLIDRGLRGELVARALVTFAYYRAVEADHPSLDPAIPPLYSQGCKLTTFIQELFRETYANKILDSVPDNTSSDEVKVKFRDAFKDARVCFTHFAKMADNTSTSTSAMFAALVRGFAAICYSEQNLVDLMLPILLWDGLLCEEVMSAVMIQVKRRAKNGTTQAYAIDETKVGFFLRDSTQSKKASTRPYISLVLELGVQKSATGEAKTHTKARVLQKRARSTKKSSAPLKKPRSSSSALKETTLSGLKKPEPGRNTYVGGHPRYSIFAYGCSSTVYKVIEPSQKADFVYLLALGDFLDEHSRKSQASLMAVRKMKPFWTAGDSCYHWIENKLLATTEVDDFVEDGVVTGGSGEAMVVLEGGEVMDVGEGDEGEGDEGEGDEVMDVFDEVMGAVE